jgi:hypothetical protein
MQPRQSCNTTNCMLCGRLQGRRRHSSTARRTPHRVQGEQGERAHLGPAAAVRQQGAAPPHCQVHQQLLGGLRASGRIICGRHGRAGQGRAGGRGMAGSSWKDQPDKGEGHRCRQLWDIQQKKPSPRRNDCSHLPRPVSCVMLPSGLRRSACTLHTAPPPLSMFESPMAANSRPCEEPPYSKREMGARVTTVPCQPAVVQW